MSTDDHADRLDAVEHALADDTEPADGEERSRDRDVERLERRVAELEATVGELEAAVEAVRGYAGNVRAVNRDVERRASAALAKVEALESSLGPPGSERSADPGQQLSREPTVIAETEQVRSTGDRGSKQSRSTGDRRSEHSRSTTDRGLDRETGQRERTADDAGDADGQPTDPADDGVDSNGTEQFIERVRDAL